MASGGDIKETLDALSGSLLAVIRTANQLAGEDVDFHRSLDSSIGTRLDRQNARLLDLTQRLLGNALPSADAVRPRLTDVDSIDEQWKGIVDVLDNLLEKADTSLDEFSGAVRRLSPSAEQALRASTRTPRFGALSQQSDLAKPQLKFDHVPTNDEVPPFVPLLNSKPHAIVPLVDSLQKYEGEEGLEHLAHPYLQEIEQYEYPSFVYTRADPTPYLPFETTTATFVDTYEGVEEMLQELRQAKEIAIDLEHHDYRSYIGLVSLMQISTREKDWIVDTLKPWRRKLSVLNQVFADPQKLKVLHGSHMDMIWLQRDLGLYVVGLFDTHHASRVLGYPGGSLAFLLKKFVDFDAQKQYQMADWRTRPLSPELFDYARSDTHFLLYIYDNMRNELLDRSNLMLEDPTQDKLNEVLIRSKEYSLQVYNHPKYDYERGIGAGGWFKMMQRTPAMFTKEQFNVFRALHQWRDSVAREQDDSTHFVLSNNNLITIAKEMPLELSKLFGICQGSNQTIRLRADEVLAVIRRGQDSAADGPELRDALNKSSEFLYGEPLFPTAIPVPQALSPAPKQDQSDSTKPVQQLNIPLGSLRATASSFWGKVVGSIQRRKMSTTTPRMIIPFPDPRIVEMHQRTAEQESENEAVDFTPAVDITPSKTEIFSVRSVSAKRKADEFVARHPGVDGLATNNDEISIGDPELDQRKEEKARLRAERKAAKRAKRDSDARVSMNGTASLAGDEPFDYAAAPSVLHSHAAQARPSGRDRDRDAKKERGAKKEPFNLSRGLGDVGKGLGRRQKETAGRSMTFGR